MSDKLKAIGIMTDELYPGAERPWCGLCGETLTQEEQHNCENRWKYDGLKEHICQQCETSLRHDEDSMEQFK